MIFVAIKIPSFLLGVYTICLLFQNISSTIIVYEDGFQLARCSLEYTIHGTTNVSLQCDFSLALHGLETLLEILNENTLNFVKQSQLIKILH